MSHGVTLRYHDSNSAETFNKEDLKKYLENQFKVTTSNRNTLLLQILLMYHACVELKNKQDLRCCH